MEQKTVKTLLFSGIKAYSSLLFLDNRYVGFVIFAITLTNPSVAFGGVVAILVSIIFAEFIGFKESYLAQGFYLYNSLLVGMGIGYIFAPSLFGFLLIVIASIFTFLLSFFLNRLFSVYKIPILSLPFSIITMFLYLASLKYSNLLGTLVNNATHFDIYLPLAISGFFQSFGTIFFLPNNIVGILLFIMVLYFSRILAFMALVGYYFGVFLHSLLIGSLEQALHDPFAFNYILVGIALCGIFLLPTARNFVLSIIGVAISVVLTDAIATLFTYYAIPVFTLPFNFTVISFIFFLSTIFYKEFNLEIKQTPEASLVNFLSKLFRFAPNTIQIALPFSGKWAVYQAFDDVWTHKGEYKYAYDFVITKEGKSYQNSGDYLQDYFAFGQSILACVNGFVVSARDDLADNLIGQVDRINNWGNYIIIKSNLGYFVKVCHLMQYSLHVKVGDYVNIGDIIAKCGNSGYSPQPHIHIQVQSVGVLGGVTIPFAFSEYIQNDKLYFCATPQKGEQIEAVVANKNIAATMDFILDDIYTYEVYENNTFKEEVQFCVKMDKYSKLFLEDAAGNRLYFFSDSEKFYFYDYIGGASYLQKLFLYAPRIPFVSNRVVTFREYPPLYLTCNAFNHSLKILLATFSPSLYKKEQQYRFDGKCITTPNSKVCLSDTNKSLTLIAYDSTTLRRKL